MARTTKKKEPSQSNELLTALKFVALAQHSDGETYKVHCKLSKNMAVSFDGVLSCGHPINDGLEAQPHTATLVKALTKCSASVSLTHVDDQILVASGAFKVRVPCEPMSLVSGSPDAPRIGVNTNLLAAVGAVTALPEDEHDNMSCRTVLIQANSAVACHRGHVLIEAWHGHDAIDAKLAVPIRSAKAMVSAGKNAIYLGYSERSVTVHYDDGSWIKSQLAEGRWYEYGSLFNGPFSHKPLPEGFKEALSHLKDFTQDGRVRFAQDVMQTSDSDKIGASFECLGLQPGRIFSIEYLKHAMKVEGEFDLYADKGCVFQGSQDGVQVRGLVARMLT